MPVVIPVGFAHIIHPVTDNTSGRQFTVTYGVQYEPEATNEEIVTAADTAWRAGYPTSSLDSNFTLQPAIGYIRAAQGLFVAQSTLATAPGITARSSPPPQVSVVIRKRTETVGRSQRGRYFLPFPYIAEGDITEQGTISSGVVATIQGRADAHLTGLQGAGDLIGGMWLLHGDAVNSPDEVLSVPVQTIVRTQRRRLPRQ